MSISKHTWIRASYQQVVLFDEMLQDLRSRNRDIDPETVARIAADTWFHIFSYFPQRDFYAADGGWGLFEPSKQISHRLQPTAGDHLDHIEWDVEDEHDYYGED